MEVVPNNMRAPLAKLALLLLLAAAGCANARAQGEGPRKTHLFLLDVSLSMRMGGYDRYANLDKWLVRPMLDSGAFAQGDRVVVRWFHERRPGGVAFSANDPERKLPLTAYTPQAVLDALPRSEQLYGQSTNIPQALDLALADIRGFDVGGDVLIWLLTDNFQQSGSPGSEASTDIRPFYKKISDNRELFRAAYLFPLLNENGVKLGAGKEAMILYLLHSSARPSGLNTNELASSVAAAIGNPVITWFPLGKNVVPEPVPAEEGETQINGDTWVLGTVPEGRPLNFGDIRFQLRSKLRSRYITGDIRAQENAEMAWPSTLAFSDAGAQPPAREGGAGGESDAAPEATASAGEASQPAEAAASTTSAPSGRLAWNVSITPSRLEIAPGEKSKTVYTVSLASDAAPRAASFWMGLRGGESAPVSGVLNFAIENLRAEVQTDDSALDFVANREIIKEIIRQSVEEANSRSASAGNRNFSLPVEFRVAYDSTGRRAQAGVVAFGALALASGIGLALLKKTRYELTTPAGERQVALPLVGREYLSLNGGRAAVITRRFGRPTIRPLPNYLIDGSSSARALPDTGDSFVVESQADGKGYPVTWRQHRRDVMAGRPKDDFFD